MKTARESGVKARIVNRVKETGRFAMRMPVGPYQRAGTPDILVHLWRPRGRACWVEAKKPNEEPTALQVAVMNELRRSGAVVLLVHNPEETMAGIQAAEDSWSPSQEKR